MRNSKLLSLGWRNSPLILALFCFQMIASSVMAQTIYPVSVSSQMIIGGSVYIGDFANPMATANKLNYTLKLEDPVETERTVYFRVTIAQNGTIIASNPIASEVIKLRWSATYLILSMAKILRRTLV